MRLANRAARDHVAHSRLVEAAQELANQLELPDDLVERIQTQKGDPPTRAMHQREAMADLLDECLKKVEALKTKIEALKVEPALKAEIEALKVEPAKTSRRGKRGGSK